MSITIEEAMRLLAKAYKDHVPECDCGTCDVCDGWKSLREYNTEQVAALSLGELIKTLSAEPLGAEARYLMNRIEDNIHKEKPPCVILVERERLEFKDTMGFPNDRRVVLRRRVPGGAGIREDAGRQVHFCNQNGGWYYTDEVIQEAADECST